MFCRNIYFEELDEQGTGGSMANIFQQLFNVFNNNNYLNE